MDIRNNNETRFRGYVSVLGYEWKLHELHGRAMLALVPKEDPGGIIHWKQAPFPANVASEFARTEVNEQQIEAFATKYGTLGFREGTPPALRPAWGRGWVPGSTLFYESAAVHAREEGGKIAEDSYGCSPEAWAFEVAKLRAAWRLADSISSWDRAAVSEFVEEDGKGGWHCRAPSELTESVLGEFAIPDSAEPVAWLDRQTANWRGLHNSDVFAAARLLLSDTITAAMANGVDAAVAFIEVKGEYLPSTVFVPRSLLHAIWLQFAETLHRGIARAACEVCGDPFPRGSVRSVGIKRSDSKVCSNRCKTERTRDREEEMRRLLNSGKSATDVAKETGGTVQKAQRLLRELKLISRKELNPRSPPSAGATKGATKKVAKRRI